MYTDRQSDEQLLTDTLEVLNRYRNIILTLLILRAKWVIMVFHPRNFKHCYEAYFRLD